MTVTRTTLVYESHEPVSVDFFPSFAVKELENCALLCFFGTTYLSADCLSRNVGKKLPLLAAQ